MLSRALILILLLFASYLGYENFTLKKEQTLLSQELKKANNTLEQEKKTDAQLRQKLSEESTLLQQQKTQLEKEIQKNVEDLKGQQIKLMVLRKSIEDLKSPASDRGADLNQRLQMNKDQIKDLEAKLKSAEHARKELDQEKNVATKNQKILNKNQVDSVSSGIQTQLALIKTTQGQLSYWRQQKRDPNYNLKVTDYEQQLKSQREDLLRLQEQKSNLQQDLQQRTNAIQNKAIEETSEIKDSEGQIRDQLERVKNEQKDLLSSLDEIRKNKVSNQNRLHQLEQEYNIEDLKIKNLESLLRQQQSELQKLNP